MLTTPLLTEIQECYEVDMIEQSDPTTGKQNCVRTDVRMLQQIIFCTQPLLPGDLIRHTVRAPTRGNNIGLRICYTDVGPFDIV
jgi:hypothetical protein